MNYYLFCLAVFFALFINTSIGAMIGFANPLYPLLPMMLYLVVTVFTKKMRYEKIPVLILIFAIIMLLFKLSIGQVYFIEIGRLLLIPMFMYVCFNNMPAKYTITLRRLLIVFYVIYCVLAIVEKVLTHHFFPVSTDIEWSSSVGIFRSASLLWHPLAGGFFCAIFMAFLSVTKCKNKIIQIGLFFLGYISLFCFDARGATIVVTLIVLPYFVWEQYKMNEKMRGMIILGVICMFGVMVYLVTQTSLGGGRLLTGDIMDGSSQTRLDVFKFYKHYKNMDDFIWGHLDNYRFMMDALGAGGVENGIITLILFYGIIFTPFILLFLFLLQYNSYSIYSKFDKWMLLLVFFSIGSMNPNLAHPLGWQLWIFTFFAFKPIEDQQEWALRIS